MNGQAPDRLGTMLNDLPVGHAPIAYLLSAGQAAKRRRGRALVSGAAAVTALVVGGGVVAGNAIITRSPAGRDTPAASAPAEPSVPSTPVDLPTSDWEPGDFAYQARISGTLALDENGCVFLDHPGYGERTYAIWPAGYTATTDPDGQVTLRAPDGTEVAHSGEVVSMGGSYGPAPDDPRPCLPRGEGEVARIQSEVANYGVLPPQTSAGSSP